MLAEKEPAALRRPNAFYLVRHSLEKLDVAAIDKVFADVPLQVRECIKPGGDWYVVGFGVSRFLQHPYPNGRTRLQDEFFNSSVARDAYPLEQRGNVLFCAEPEPGLAGASKLERRLKAVLHFAGLPLCSAAALREHLRASKHLDVFYHPSCRRYWLPGWAEETMLMHEKLWESLEKSVEKRDDLSDAYLELPGGLPRLFEVLLPQELREKYAAVSPWHAVYHDDQDKKADEEAKKAYQAYLAQAAAEQGGAAAQTRGESSRKRKEPDSSREIEVI